MTKPHSDECRTRMDELVQHDDDALVLQWLHADRHRRGSTVSGSSGYERSNPDAEAVGSGLPKGSTGDAPRATRTGAEAGGNSGGAPRAEAADKPMGTAAEDVDVRRGLKRSAELPPWCAVVENTSMKMCRLSRQVYSEPSKQRSGCSRCSHECGQDGHDLFQVQLRR